jgi:hypothetical protein
MGYQTGARQTPPAGVRENIRPSNNDSGAFNAKEKWRAFW